MKPIKAFLAAIALFGASGCSLTGTDTPEPRLALFVGVDVSGSYAKSDRYDDSLAFLARYLEAHLAGAAGLERPAHLFVGPIGGVLPSDAKTFYPIQAFERKPADELQAKLSELFPKQKVDPYTDFNAFFAHVAQTARERNLLLKPISIVVLSDGIVDSPDGKAAQDPRSIVFTPLETLSRDVTVRLLYTDPRTGAAWKAKVPRRRVKLFCQDAAVMTGWKEAAAADPAGGPSRLLPWINDNVDYPVRAQRVD